MLRDENVIWHDFEVSKHDRELLLNQKGIVLLLTGLSGSGKSTIAKALEARLYKDHYLVYILDGDNVRHGINKDLGFGEKDRKENMRRIGELAKLFSDIGVITILSFIAPFEKEREQIRSLIGDSFLEIYIDCDLKTCMSRDPKGLYQKVINGKIKNFTGIDSVYEIPSNPDLIIDSNYLSTNGSMEVIYEFLENKIRKDG